MANGQLKTGNLILRITPKDKEELKIIADKRGMTMSEMVLYLVRREIDWDRKDKKSKDEEELKAIADMREMSLSEMLLYAIRKDMDWEKYKDDRNTYTPSYED